MSALVPPNRFSGVNRAVPPSAYTPVTLDTAEAVLALLKRPFARKSEGAIP